MSSLGGIIGAGLFVGTSSGTQPGWSGDHPDSEPHKPRRELVANALRKAFGPPQRDYPSEVITESEIRREEKAGS
jgi:hypothetical protein